MSNPSFLFTNINDYAITASHTAVTNRDVNNLKSYFTDDVWESSATGVTQSLIIDLGSVQTIDTVIFDNHNLPSVMGGGKIQLLCADNYGFTVNSATAINKIFSSTFGAEEFDFTPVTNRYFKLLYNGSTREKPYLGNIFLGERLQFPRTYIYNFNTKNPQNKVDEYFNLKGTIRTNEVDIIRDIYELNFKLMTDSFRQDFITFVKSIRGKAKPFYFRDSDDTVRYAQLMADYSPAKIQNYNLNDLASINFRTLLINYLYGERTIIPNLLETDDIIL